MLFVIEYFSFYRGLVTSTDVLLVQLERLSYAQVYYTQKFVIQKIFLNTIVVIWTGLLCTKVCYMQKFLMYSISYYVTIYFD